VDRLRELLPPPVVPGDLGLKAGLGGGVHAVRIADFRQFYE
jgi:hypothetical protein